MNVSLQLYYTFPITADEKKTSTRKRKEKTEQNQEEEEKVEN